MIATLIILIITIFLIEIVFKRIILKRLAGEQRFFIFTLKGTTLEYQGKIAIDTMTDYMNHWIDNNIDRDNEFELNSDGNIYNTDIADNKNLDIIYKDNKIYIKIKEYGIIGHIPKDNFYDIDKFLKNDNYTPLLKLRLIETDQINPNDIEAGQLPFLIEMSIYFNDNNNN